MIPVLAYGLAAALLIAFGLYGFVAHRHPLRQLLSANVAGSGVFLLFGALARRTAEGDGDPVPHAMIITGIVVALSATALGVALIGRLQEAGAATSLPDGEEQDGG